LTLEEEKFFRILLSSCDLWIRELAEKMGDNIEREREREREKLCKQNHIFTIVWHLKETSEDLGILEGDDEQQQQQQQQ